MIQIFLFISISGVLFIFKYLIGFLDENYEKEETIIRDVLSGNKCSNVLNRNENEYDYKFKDIETSALNNGNNSKDSGIKFYTFTENIPETNSDNLTSKLNGKCA